MPTTDPQRRWVARRIVGVDFAWILVAIGLLAIIGLVAVIAADRPKGPERAVAGGLGVSAPPAQFPDPALPLPIPVRSPSPAPTASPTGNRADDDAADYRTGDRGPRPTASRTPTTKPRDNATGLIVGRRVSLEPAALPGFRLRHRDFRARVDRLSSASRALDRADATFTVRAGLANTRCTSFESINYPGFFLRHQNFALFLQPKDGSGLFAADATFCPVTGRGATTLRSVNYPDRSLVQRGSLLFLDRVPPATAVSFVVRPPL